MVNDPLNTGTFNEATECNDMLVCVTRGRERTIGGKTIGQVVSWLDVVLDRLQKCDYHEVRLNGRKKYKVGSRAEKYNKMTYT